MKYVVITGSSGGMGTATVKKYIDNGYFVFGLDNQAPSYQLDNFKYISTDVRDASHVINAFNIVKQETDEIEAIINMVGITELKSLVEISEEDFINIFNSNVFGMYRVNKTFLPLLKEKGKVIIVSSELAPLEPLPFVGIYGITKTTVEKYAYSLRMELQLLNKYVVVIRPGAVDTPMIEASAKKIDNFQNDTQLYSYNAKRFKNITDGVQSKNIPPERIAKLIYKVSNKKKPKYIYKINRNAGLLILNALPKRAQNWIIKKILAKKNKKR